MLNLWIFVSFILFYHRISVFSLNNTCEIEPSRCIDSNDDQLIFAQVIYRHGQRNPNQYNFPNDPYKDEEHWPGGWVQLTNEGKKQMYNLGQYFRHRYGGILGDKYSYKKIYVQSTDSDQAIASALANLAGLYPPQNDELWNDSIKWQPIPIHTIPFKSDIVMFYGLNCTKFFKTSVEYEKTPEIQKIYKDYDAQFLYWSKICGKKIKTIFNVAELYSTISFAKFQNKPLAEWQENEIQPNGTMEYITQIHCKMASGTKQLARLFSGPLIKEIFQRFGQKINSTLTPDRSVWIYSAHDLMISNLLNSLGLFELHIPPFAASLHFELYETNQNEHYIQFFYRKSNEENPTAMQIPECGQKCTLERLYDLYNDIIPIDLQAECMAP